MCLKTSQLIQVDFSKYFVFYLFTFDSSDKQFKLFNKNKTKKKTTFKGHEEHFFVYKRQLNVLLACSFKVIINIIDYFTYGNY